MKQILLTTLAFLFASTAFAQVADSTGKGQIRYNQYGVPVNRTPLFSEERNGVLVFESKNEDYKIWFDSRVQVDGAAFFGENEDYDPIGNGVSIRRARFAIKGQVTKDWYGEVDLDFANGILELKDAYLMYSGVKNLEFQAGNFKEGFSMESTTTSRYLPFMERPMVVQTFAPSRHIGAQVKTNLNWFMATAGVFFQAVEDAEIRTNVADNNKDYGRGAGYSVTAKMVAMPFYEDSHKGLHIGLAGSYRTPKSDMATSEFGGVRYSTRTATSINRKKYLDTDVIRDVHHDLLYGAELAGYFGGLRMQGEYIGNITYLNNPVATVSGETSRLNFSGWYAQAGYLLFGGQQRYNTHDGEFTQPSRGRGWGDLELLFRYDYLNLNCAPVYGGSGQNYSAGLNYYVNNNVKIMLNYMYSDHDRYANGKGKLLVGHDASGAPTKDYTKVVEAPGKAGVDYHTLSVRFEIDF